MRKTDLVTITNAAGVQQVMPAEQAAHFDPELARVLAIYELEVPEEAMPSLPPVDWRTALLTGTEYVQAHGPADPIRNRYVGPPEIHHPLYGRIVWDHQNSSPHDNSDPD